MASIFTDARGPTLQLADSAQTTWMLLFLANKSN
jgi:hypothetical protein